MSVSAHKGSHFLYALDRERRFAKRFERNAHQLHGVVVGGSSVRAKLSASFAAVYDRPFSALSHPDRNGFHNAAAVRFAVARLYVHMKARKAVRTVVAVTAARVFGRNEPPAYLAGEAVAARVRLVISLIICFAFVFAVHCDSS